MPARHGWIALALAAELLGACDLASLGETSGGPAVLTGRAGTRDPEILIVGRPEDAVYLDPARPTDNESVEVLEQIYDPLIRYRPGSMTLEPGLASSWEVSPDGRRWTFHLVHDVRFHDGTPFDADAVVFSLERQRDPRHPFHRDDFLYWENLYRGVQEVEKIDDYTVAITIERSYAPFEANMAMFPVAIVSPTAVARYGDEFPFHPVGTGPFRFVSWERGSRIVLERNPDYWGRAPAFAKLVFQVIRDARQRLVALESSAIDIAYSILPEELQFVALHPNLRLHETAANNVSYLAMNTLKPPFDNVEIRQAVNYAINKEAIVKLVYQGLAVPADGPLPPNQWGYHRVREPYAYDPDRARAMLRAAAAAGRFDSQRTYTLYVPSTPRPYLQDAEGVGHVLQANLDDVGLKVDLIYQPFRLHSQSIAMGEHDLCVMGWVGDNGDPDNFLYVLLDRDNTVPGLARNVAFFRDSDVHYTLVQAQESDDRLDRERLYMKAQELIHQQAPWVPLAHSQVAVAARDDIGGMLLNPTGHVTYKDVRRLPQ